MARRAVSSRRPAKAAPDAGLAHDINNLLSVVIADCILLAEQGPRHGRARAENGLRAARSAAALLRLMLDPAPRPERFDAASVLQELAALLAPVLGDSIVLTVAPVGALPLRADRTQFLSAVLNLALNARNAMPDGGQLTIGGRRDGASIVIEVADSGGGIDKAALRGGSGLGLRQVRRFVRAAKGKFHIDSAPGRGTRATLVLPRG